VGASMGGMIAQNVAADFPARVATLTSIMSTTGNRKLPGPTAKARRALLTTPARRGDIEGATRRMVSVLRDIGSVTHPAEEGYLRGLCERQVKRAHNPAAVARQLVAIAASGDRTKTVRRIKAPTLVIHGDEDPLIPPAAGEDTARVIREGGGEARVAIVHGMGHDLPVPLLPQIAELIAEHCRRMSRGQA
jgi:pimeloyl-ACP methyl ester carboxylesterase